MSLCYDFQKWTIISMAAVAISLTIGLVSLAYGQTLDNETALQKAETALQKANKLIQEIKAFNTMQKQREPLINYCYQHADRPNPIQDLIDKGFLPDGFKETCKSVKQAYDATKLEIEQKEKEKEEQQEIARQKQQAERKKLSDIFHECTNTMHLKNMTYEECYTTVYGNLAK
jgi:hypothetical protein